MSQNGLFTRYIERNIVALIKRSTTSIDVFKASVNRPVGARKIGNETERNMQNTSNEKSAHEV